MTLTLPEGYTHKLIAPNAVRLEAARAYIEWACERLDGGEHNLPTEGAVAKYMATESGNKAAEDAIQALGGYGYTFAPPSAEALPIPASDIYKVFFHGPAYQVIERGGVSGASAITLFPGQLPPNSQPQDVASLMAPRLVELCFQTAALWSVQTKSAMAFPLGIGRVTAYRQPECPSVLGTDAGRRLYCLCTTGDDGESFDAQVVDEAGNVFVDLTGYRTVARPGVTIS